ncbi:hypothetical protein ATKI12_5519 [Kitasatospora sp. Ki12]
MADGEALGGGQRLVRVAGVGDPVVGDVGQLPGRLVLGEEDDAVVLGDLLQRVAAVLLVAGGDEQEGRGGAGQGVVLPGG